ncbi:hypothetical protein XO10_06775 [Marinitoga sp. 1135]|uniref:Uncharacterized protein n=1 Tax=Marinitoga piezophila (strain DSM 14283 / JCM 11233 / KA3) TaxID=443254 RepID=H2J3F7_MARPK|nr:MULTISPECIES: hypothetical protein [Marinitoga]AEX85773.1 hypothetical protein Marpi_1373 [Marinitoga piezophila KA3]APT76215.1 hypothetical protein LN42_07335 [Marinitoga sp. 1137]NUU95974.1 hypothetical protein [Marinitoga sp. 1135]NUU97886.1 hypothetical protein [Marinitoga sp. 1138]
MINGVSGVGSYQYTPQINTRNAASSAANQQMAQKTSQDFDNLLNAIVYQQDGLTRKLVRIIGDMYQGKNLDILA